MKNKSDPEGVVKCACGLPMRRKDWSDHWSGCRRGSPVPATEDDITALEHHEAEAREWTDRCDREHEAWMAAQKA